MSASVPDTIANTKAARTTRATNSPGVPFQALMTIAAASANSAPPTTTASTVRGLEPCCWWKWSMARSERSAKATGAASMPTASPTIDRPASHPGGLPTAANSASAPRVSPALTAVARRPSFHCLDSPSSVRARVSSPPAAR